MEMEQVIANEVIITNWDIVLEKIDVLVDVMQNMSMLLFGAIVGLTIIVVMSRW